MWCLQMGQLCCCGTGERWALCWLCQQQMCEEWWPLWVQTHSLVRVAMAPCLVCTWWGWVVACATLSWSKMPGCCWLHGLLLAASRVCGGHSPKSRLMFLCYSSASATKQGICLATLSTCGYYYKNNHKEHGCWAHQLYHLH